MKTTALQQPITEASHARLALFIKEVAAGRTYIDPVDSEHFVPNESARR